LAYRFDGKQKTLALGKYPHVSLADARSKRDAAKALLAAGTDPSQHAKEEKARTRAAGANTFDAVASEFLKKVTRDGRAEITIAKKRWILDTVSGDIGNRPVSEITASEVLATLRKVEAKGHFETARRMRETISQVFRYAIATARAENDPTFGLRGALTSPTVTHRPAITDRKAFGGLLRAVWEYGGNQKTRAALQLMAILYPRPGELRHADWAEFDLDKATWTIPAARTKMRREHKKPLPPKAVEILTSLRDMPERALWYLHRHLHLSARSAKTH
jgi:integrase